MKLNAFKISVFFFILLGLSAGFYAITIRAQQEPVSQTGPAREEEAPVLTLEEFVKLAAARDTEFEEILIDELTLKYEKALQLPARDLVLSVRRQHEFFVNADRDSPDTTVGLSKLFPMTGTEVTADYEVGASLTSATDSASLSVELTQPIAQNAFGRSTRLLDKIVGLETDVARHQIVEAYEDYFAALMTAYYTWYEDYENLMIGRSSYKENSKLLDNMKERERQKIALPIDVNKVKLQVLSKEERLTELQEQYKNSSNVIARSLREPVPLAHVPALGEPVTEVEGEFAGMFSRFRDESRTFDILNMLEEKSTLEVKREADDLLPSLDIVAGYDVSATDFNLVDENAFYYAGVSLEWPFGDQVDRAEYEVAKVNDDKRKLITTNTYFRLYTQLLNLYHQIERERALVTIAAERITLARDILTDEEENYSFGKVSLNDYIQAFNDLDTNRFNQITHDALYRKLLIEWQRLNDELIHKAGLEFD